MLVHLELMALNPHGLLFLLHLVVNSALNLLAGDKRHQILSLLLGNVFAIKLLHTSGEKNYLVPILGDSRNRVVFQINNSQAIHGLKQGANLILKIVYQIVL